MLQQTVLHVEGMSCGSCVSHVRRALSALAGVSDVKVELRQGRVDVEHDANATSVETLVATLRDAGYDATATS